MPVKAPIWFTIIAIIILIWNLMGLSAFFLDPQVGGPAIETMPPEQQAIYQARPSWVFIAFGISVVSGALGALLLLLRRNLALSLFVISLVTVLVQLFWFATNADIRQLLGPGEIILQATILLFLLLSIWMCRKARASGWSR